MPVISEAGDQAAARENFARAYHANGRYGHASEAAQKLSC